MSDRWDQHFLQLAIDHARMSKDPSTRVGAVIVGPDREIRSSGFNGFPRGIEDTAERLADREMKLRLIVHAEMNAVLNAVRGGAQVKGCSLYLAATDSYHAFETCNTWTAVALYAAGLPMRTGVLFEDDVMRQVRALAATQQAMGG